MTRINTNVSSLVAQNTLSRSSADLQQSLTRLSTGLRINSGKDDPAGLIASETLRADMTSIEKAISNSTRANLLIGTADSALQQVGNLLNDIRGLVVEAANVGTLSTEQIEANQLQVDSSLEAINRIAQTTTFQGRRLLDGSLAFNTNINTVPSVRDVQIDQANLGAAGEVAVNVDISAAATVAEVSNTDAFTAGANATVDITLSSGLTIENNATGSFLYLNAQNLGEADGVQVAFVQAGATSIDYDGTTLTVNADFATGVTVASIAAAINADADTQNVFAASSTGAGTFVAADVAADKGSTSADVITLDAVNTGADYNGVRVSVVAGAANAAVYDDVQKTLTITVANTAQQTTAALAAAIQGAATVTGVFTATAAGGSGVVNAANEEVEQNRAPAQRAATC